MTRTVGRNVLACLWLAAVLAFTGTALKGPFATPAAAADHGRWQARVDGVIRHIGLSGLDRPTPAALAEARVPEPVASDAACLLYTSPSPRD